jgi:hypothetical protein
VSSNGRYGCAILAPPVWRDITRGTRGVSGILQRVQGPARFGIPSAFTPSQVV